MHHLILLTAEVATTQTVRYDIRKRVRMYGHYMLLFFDVTVGFVSSFFLLYFPYLGFRVYISCPQNCSIAKQHENSPSLPAATVVMKWFYSILTGSQTTVS